MGWTRRDYAVAIVPPVLLLSLIVAVQAMSPALRIEVYGVDTLFVLDVISRVATGAVPHVDFTLHLGALPFAMIAATGPVVATAFMTAQWCLAAILVVLGLWLCRNRLPPLATAFLLISVVILATALSASFNAKVTLGLFYNRWAWALTLVFLIAVLVPPRESNAWLIDGAIVGLLSMGLLTTKITFFVALIPVGLFSVAIAGRWREILAALLTFCAIAAAIAVLWGPAFWIGYFENLVWVANNPVRQTLGRSMFELVIHPKLFPYFLCLTLLAVLVARHGTRSEFAGFVLAAIALFLIQYQNFGFAPIWVFAVTALALNLLNSIRSNNQGRDVLTLTAVIALLCLSALSALPMLRGTWNNATVAHVNDQPMIPGNDTMVGLVVTEPQVTPVIELTFPLSDDAPPHMTTCHAPDGFLTVYRNVAEALRSVDAPVFVADGPSPHWLQNGKPPLRDVPPWNYGSLRGLEAAGFVAVPRCPHKPNYQEVILRNITDEGIQLSVVRDTPWVRIMTWSRASQDNP